MGLTGRWRVRAVALRRFGRLQAAAALRLVLGAWRSAVALRCGTAAGEQQPLHTGPARNPPPSSTDCGMSGARRVLQAGELLQLERRRADAGLLSGWLAFRGWVAAARRLAAQLVKLGRLGARREAAAAARAFDAWTGQVCAPLAASPPRQGLPLLTTNFEKDSTGTCPPALQLMWWSAKLLPRRLTLTLTLTLTPPPGCQAAAGRAVRRQGRRRTAALCRRALAG